MINVNKEENQIRVSLEFTPSEQALEEASKHTRNNEFSGAGASIVANALTDLGMIVSSLKSHIEKTIGLTCAMAYESAIKEHPELLFTGTLSEEKKEDIRNADFY